MSSEEDRFLRNVNIVSNRNFESATSHTNILDIRHSTKNAKTRFEKDFFASYFSLCHRHLGTGTRKSDGI